MSEIAQEFQDKNIEKPEDVQEKKEKKPRSEKQIASFLKAREKMSENAKMRKEHREMTDKLEKNELQERIVTKAIKIKRKQIKQEKILVDSDEERHESDNEIKKKKRINKDKVINKEKVVFNYVK
jgi:hypothetical protein